jgi:hypothetical protein
VSSTVALLPTVFLLRNKVVDESASLDDLKTFARSLVCVEDIYLLLSRVRHASPKFAKRCLSAAFYQGGISGVGDLVIERIDDEAYRRAIALEDLVLVAQVENCEDPSALHALSAMAPCEEAVMFDLRDLEKRLGLARVQDIAAQSHNYYLRILDRLKTAPTRKDLWYLKQFQDPEVRKAFSEAAKDPDLSITASYCLQAFYQHDFGSLHFYSLGRSSVRDETVDIAQCMNMIALSAIRRRDEGALQVACTLGRSSFSKAELAFFESWCKARFVVS